MDDVNWNFVGSAQSLDLWLATPYPGIPNRYAVPLIFLYGHEAGVVGTLCILATSRWEEWKEVIYVLPHVDRRGFTRRFVFCLVLGQKSMQGKLVGNGREETVAVGIYLTGKMRFISPDMRKDALHIIRRPMTRMSFGSRSLLLGPLFPV